MCSCIVDNACCIVNIITILLSSQYSHLPSALMSTVDFVMKEVGPFGCWMNASDNLFSIILALSLKTRLSALVTRLPTSLGSTLGKITP